MYIQEINEEIEDIDYLEGELTAHLDGYLELLAEEEGMTREPVEDDMCDERCDFVWTPKAQKLIDAKFRELYAIAEKYDPDNEYDITSYMYYEP